MRLLTQTQLRYKILKVSQKLKQNYFNTKVIRIIHSNKIRT